MDLIIYAAIIVGVNLSFLGVFLYVIKKQLGEMEMMMTANEINRKILEHRVQSLLATISALGNHIKRKMN
jgi:hypothetical protein